MRINGKKPRQDSRIRDRETGYDRLNGLNDGEADLDESAPQAEGDGSEAFLRGVEGPSGEYHFPMHRLRTTMKGESV
jgi:nicotinamide mononucleotide adenylyltransferase